MNTAKTNSPRGRIACRGFTLVELLVVITIIGILISLLLPAVQGARESARKALCENNVKQLALGCLNCEQSYGALPNGGWVWTWEGDPDRGHGMKQPGGWIYNILPFIEQQALHDLGAGQPQPQKSNSMATAAQTPLAALICPSRRPVMAFPNVNNPCNITAVPTAVHTDYAANSGTIGPTFPNFPASGDPTFTDAPGYTFPVVLFDGAISCVAALPLSKITDGASNTYLLGEKYIPSDDYLNSQDGGDNNPVYAGFDWDWHRWGISTPQPGTSASTQYTTTTPQQDMPGYTDYTTFGSAHSTGLNMAFCDGSVHSIAYSIDQETHRRLCCRYDGMAVDPSKY